MEYKEDLNRQGFYWTFMVERADINLGNTNKARIMNRCPFVPITRSYVEDLIRRMINIAIDEYQIRNFAKLKAMLKSVYSDMHDQAKAPKVKEIDVMGDGEGLRVFVVLGTGYMVDFPWTEFNDHKDQMVSWLKESGDRALRASIDSTLTGLDKQA
jgi:hypothetical protein